MENSMNKLRAVLALLVLISSVTVADARGGRTTAKDCDAGSDDPDCPDAPTPPKWAEPAKANAQLIAAPVRD
jgi:hypothetical protein